MSAPFSFDIHDATGWGAEYSPDGRTVTVTVYGEGFKPLGDISLYGDQHLVQVVDVTNITDSEES